MAENQWLSHHTLPFWCHHMHRSEYRTLCSWITSPCFGKIRPSVQRNIGVFKGGISQHISTGKAVQGITFHSRECSSVRGRLPDAQLTVFSSRSSASSAECCICFCTPCLMFLVYLNTKILSAVQNWHNWF